MKNLILFLFVIFSCAKSFAHALWIETASTGKVGQKQEINIYYGEYAENEREDTSKWYSDVEAFTLWLVDAKNNKTQLPTTAGHNCFKGSFVPAENGVYTLLVQHAVKDFPGTTRYEFISSATVKVGGHSISNASVQNSNAISLSENNQGKKNKPHTINALFNGKPSKDLKFEVVSPTGWGKKLEADENGNLIFVPLWSGRYFIEASHTEKVEGEHAGKAYKAVWRGATYMIEVK